MSNIFGPLSDDEVRQISLLVESLDHSSLDFLQLELGDMKLTISKGNIPTASASSRIEIADRRDAYAAGCGRHVRRDDPISIIDDEKR